jgi:hypothetical protein
MGADPNNSSFRYWAFISYSHADEEFGRRLHEKLERYRVPQKLVGRPHSLGTVPRQLIPIFRDRDELPGASDLGAKIRTALASSRFLIVVCSPRSAASQYVDEEIRTFKMLGASDRVLAIIVDGEPHASNRPGREAEECFPRSLCCAFDADGRATSSRCEPIAADARPGKDGLQRALLKIVAGMLEIGFDDLMQRELSRQRSYRRKVTTAIALALTLLTMAGFYGWRYLARSHAKSLVERLVSADVQQVPEIVENIYRHRDWTIPHLRTELDGSADGSARRLYLQLALLRAGENDEVALRDQLTLVAPEQFAVVRDALQKHFDQTTTAGSDAFRTGVVEPLWLVALDHGQPVAPRFQAACAVAAYTPGDVRWSRICGWVSGNLVSRQPEEFHAWLRALSPAQRQLVESLALIYHDSSQPRQGRLQAAEALAEFSANQPEVLFDLLAAADDFQFPVVFKKLAVHKEEAIDLARREVAKDIAACRSEEEKESLARRQANAAVALYQLKYYESFWPTLRYSSDPRTRSYIIHWLSLLGSEPEPILDRVKLEPDVSVRRALLFMLGEFAESQIPPDRRVTLGDLLVKIYRDDSDPGLHGAARWLL